MAKIWHKAWNRADELIADYCGDKLSTQEIKAKYNCSLPTIWHITESKGVPRRVHQVISDSGREACRANGLKRNIYPVNNAFFDNIDCEEKAYWWGFLYADGYVGRDMKAMIVGLNSKDHAHLEKLRDVLSPTRPVRKEIKYRKDLGITTYTSILRVDNEYLGKRLHGLGMIPKRPEYSRIKNNLPIELFNHWLRGYIDGDGKIVAIAMSIIGNETAKKERKLIFIIQAG